MSDNPFLVGAPKSPASDASAPSNPFLAEPPARPAPPQRKPPALPNAVLPGVGAVAHPGAFDLPAVPAGSDASAPFLPAAPAAPASTPVQYAEQQYAAPVQQYAAPQQQYAAPLAIQPGAVAPSVKDPHAEFRRGGWQKPALFAGIAAVVVAGLFALVPQPDAFDKGTVGQKSTKERPVIGTSLPPNRTTEPEMESAENNNAAFQKAEAEARGQGEKPERPADIPSEGDFAGAFKAAAR